ncbi:MAG: DUF262 domain-containing protein [Gammaproteobacteria bacterium]
MHCETKTFTVARFYHEREAFDVSPDFQRADVWTREKRRLFLDSLFNGYDSPKIYLRAVAMRDDETRDYAIVDGKQRFQCICDFVDGKIALSPEFKFLGHGFAVRREPFPKGGDFFADLSPFWREQFKSATLDVVVIRDAEECNLGAMFTRLNGGASLTGV